MNWTKYSGYYLCATGVIHNIIGVIMGWPILALMHQHGWFASTVIDGQMLFDREAILWFLTLGAFWIVLGLALQSALDQGFKLPAALGWGFLLLAAVLIVIVPQSGAYLFVVQGVLIILGDKSSHSISLEATAKSS